MKQPRGWCTRQGSVGRASAAAIAVLDGRAVSIAARPHYSYGCTTDNLVRRWESGGTVGGCAPYSATLLWAEAADDDEEDGGVEDAHVRFSRFER